MKRALMWLAGMAVGVSGCDGCARPAADIPTLPARPTHTGTAKVWVIDDGERIRQDGGADPLMSGEGNEVWSPGQAISLFGLRDETIAFQVVVSAGDAPLSGVTVDLADTDPRCLGTPERFVVHELPMAKRSAGRDARTSLGWTAAAMPPSVKPGEALPDPLIDVALAPSWADYPMTVARGKQRAVWIDVHIPADAPAGSCRAKVRVTAGGESLADIDLQLQVAAQSLPYRAVKTMVFYETETLLDRLGDERAVEAYEQLMHAHQLSTIMPLRSAAEVERHSRALDGSLFTTQHGYAGPGQGVGADVAVVGVYGSLHTPNDKSLARAEAIVTALEKHGVKAPERDVFLYAVDEQCDSPLGKQWRQALDASGSKTLSSLRVGHTCSTPPAQQPVDLVMMFASEYDAKLAAEARAQGKQVWIYNGVLPYTGAFLTDAWPISLRANPWIQARYEIPRWFYWESVFWNDGNRGGHGRYDPLATAETFHNADGDHCNGDGVLVYPGKQSDPGYRSLDALAILPSIRLKQWRRGISDMGYLTLARKIDRAAANAVLKRIVPTALQDARDHSKPPWSTTGRDYFKARRALFEILTRKTSP